MTDLENTNTEGVSGQNTFNADEYADKIISAIEKKNAKNEKSIIDSNFSKLSAEEQQAAYEALNEKKERVARCEKEAIARLEKERDEAIAKLNEYETAKNKETVENALKTELEKAGITDNSVDYAMKLLGSDFMKDGAVDNTLVSESIKKLIEDFPMLTAKKEIQKGNQTQSEKDKASEAEMEKMLKAIGLK